MRRFAQLASVIFPLLLVMSCAGGSDLADDEATVYLTVTEMQYGTNYYVSVCLGNDVAMESLTIQSNLKDPTGTTSSAQDVILTRWVVTPTRLDGGTPSPVWVRDMQVHVPAGSTAELENYPIYPAEKFLEPPLLYLFPENGGFDPETGELDIRQSLHVEIFGETAGGKALSFSVVLEYDFACTW